MTPRLLAVAVVVALVAACQDPSQPPLQSVRYGEILLRLQGRDIRGHFDFDSTIGGYDATVPRVVVTGSTAPGPAPPDYIGLWLEPFGGVRTYILGAAGGRHSLTFFVELSPGTDSGQRIIFKTDAATTVTVRVVSWNPLVCELRGDFAGHVRQGGAGIYPVEGAFWGRLVDFTVPGGACPDV